MTNISFITWKEIESFDPKNNLKKNNIIANPTKLWNLMFLARSANLESMYFGIIIQVKYYFRQL
jgi:hypothetical protein